MAPTVHRVRRPPVWPAAVLALALLATGAYLLYETRGLTFYFDDWSFVTERQGHSLDVFLDPHLEHLSLLPVILYKGLFETVGLAHYGPFRVMIVALHLACAALLYLVARRRIGDVLALVPAVVLLSLGPAWQDILWPFQIGFLIPLACLLGMLLALDRGDRAGDLVAGGLLVVALASSSLGVPVAVAAAVEVLLGPDRWRRLLRVIAVPAVLYGAWSLAYGEADFDSGNLSATPEYIVDAAGASVGAATSLGVTAGKLLAAALAIGVAVRLARGGPERVRLLALLAGALSFWALLGVFRPDEIPPPSRQLYPGVVFVLLIAVELARGVRPRRPVLAVAAVAAGLIVAGNVGDLHRGADRLRNFTDFVAAELGALELARAGVPAEFRPDPVLAPWVSAATYFPAVDAWGSPADTPAGILDRPEPARRAADIALAAALGVHLAPGTLPAQPGPAPAVTRGSARHAGGCLQLGAGGPVELRLPPGGLALRAGDRGALTVRLRRFGAGYGRADRAPGEGIFIVSIPPGNGIDEFKFVASFGAQLAKPAVLTLPTGDSAALRIPPDAARRPWHAAITAAAPSRVCGLPAG